MANWRKSNAPASTSRIRSAAAPSFALAREFDDHQAVLAAYPRIDFKEAIIHAFCCDRDETRTIARGDQALANRF